MLDFGILIADEIENTAEWRFEKAEQFPEDADRNLRAAGILSGIAAGLRSLEGTSSHWWLLGACRSDPNGYTDTLQQLARAVGFRSSSQNAEQFLADFRFLLQRSHDKAASVIQLEHVSNLHNA